VKGDWVDSAKLNDWMQVVGIFAVVASLIFVGLQMKQTQEIALASAYQDRATSSIDRMITRASSPEWTSARAKMDRGDFDSISPEERVSLEENLAAYIVMVENHHYQYHSGFLPEEHWLRNVTEMKCAFSIPLNRDMIKGWIFRASFQTVLDEIIADAESDPIC
jgi:hypothetical protein